MGASLMNTSHRRTPRRGRGDDGAVMVEFALMAPLLVLLALGIAEFGFVWRDSVTIVTASRSAARAASNTTGGAGNKPQADWIALGQFTAALQGIELDEINRLIIYNATGSNPATVLNACKTHNLGGAEFGGRSGECNIYTGDFLANTFDATDDSNFVGGTNWDSAWEPASRDATQAGSNMDYLGIWVEIDQNTLSGIFGDTWTHRDDVIFRLEPETIN